VLLGWFSLPSYSQMVINEVCAANGDIIIDPTYFNFSPWVELHNTGNTSTNVSGYYLSDDPALPLKWRVPSGNIIPSKGYLLIWCDKLNTGLHTNFSLDADGENLILSNSMGSQVDLISYSTHFTNMSYGRISDGGSSWRIASVPTPQAANVAGPLTAEQLSPPVFSKTGGRYPGAQLVTLSHTQSNVTIRYTTNGSEPSSASQNYSSPISVTATQVVKAKAFHNNFLPSETVTNTYLINEHASMLPVVSISTKPEYLWDNTIGIYTDGTNGIPGNCNNNPMNWNQDWDRHAVFEYFSPTGVRLVNQPTDIRIAGACSRNFAQKSFGILPEKKYGSNEIEYPFFPTKPKVKSFGSLFLRNAGNDFNTTMFRDAFIQSLGIGQVDLDYMAYQPTVFYLNGEYWGIQNLREKIDGNFIESNYKIDKSDVDLLETWENAIEGTSDAWLNYKDSLQLLSPTDPNTFSFINKHIDVQEYINYLVTEIYACNTDWPGNNVKFWRQRSTNGKFRWILWDLDFGFGLYTNQSYATHPTLNFATETNGPGWPNPPASTLHIRLVLANPEFRNKFIASMATAMGTTFNPTKVNQKITEFSQRIQSEVPYHKTRWWGTINDWNNEVQRLRDFASSRNIFMQSHVASFFNLGQPIKFSTSVSPAGSGKIDMNGINSDGMSNAPYYKGVPYRVKAVAKEGFTFSGWTVTTNNNELVTIADLGSSWKYFDQGTLPAANWNSNAYNDTGWAQGNAQLGYGDADETTTVSFGPDGANKFITTYFRKTFSIADTAGLSNISASVLFDDAVAIYLNGTEVFRSNLPAGALAYSTLASGNVPDENAITPFTINKGILKPGVNTFAVEIHQSSGASSDISFDFSASCNRIGSSGTYTVNSLEVYDTAYADVTMVANFTPIPAIIGLVLNEFTTTKSFAKDNFNEQEDWIELYNNGTSAIDLNGVWITDDLSVKNKHILSNNGSPWLLQPNSYQLLWADDQVEQGKDHLSFKLSSEGEQIGLYHVAGFNTTTFAALTYDAQTEGFSMARIPNGTGPFELTSILTPGAANQLDEEIDLDTKIAFPNPAHGFFDIYIPNELAELTLFDSRGKEVAAYTISSSEVVRIETEDFAAGLYILKIVTPTTNSTSRLVIVHP